MEFTALQITETTEGTFERNFVKRTAPELGQNEVRIAVKYAALNYKDALSATGNKGITKKYPHTPGVDASGVVAQTTSALFAVGDQVLVTGYDLGMNTNGGFGEYIQVPAAWVVPLPSAFSLKQAMVLGTAAFTAALALYKMEQNGQTPEQGAILVTGATGGVGSLAVAILAHAGYQVIAATGKPQSHAYLKTLGATEFKTRQDLNIISPRPLLSSQWAGAIDNVGGNTLANCLKACKAKGNVAACGLVQSPELTTTVFPFIIKGINLLGIDSAETPMPLRLKIWQKLSNDWNVTDKLSSITTTIPLTQINEYIDKMLQGENIGRTIIEM